MIAHQDNTKEGDSFVKTTSEHMEVKYYLPDRFAFTSKDSSCMRNLLSLHLLNVSIALCGAPFPWYILGSLYDSECRGNVVRRDSQASSDVPIEGRVCICRTL